MSATKIHEIIKKYKNLHQRHLASWEEAQKRIRIASKKIQDEANDSEHIYICEKTYQTESYNYQVKGNQLFSEMMKEFEGQEMFPKKNKSEIIKVA